MKRSVLILVAVLVTAAGAIAATGLTSRPRPADAALVFGNTVERDGRPSQRLEARLETARDLYTSRTVRVVVVSGGIGKEGFDEAAVMAAWLRARGVPDSSIVTDSQGVTTEATCANARALLGGRSVDVVTQWFHVPRAELAAARAGLDVRGAAWPRFAEFRDAYSLARETFALPVYFVRGRRTFTAATTDSTR